jgi:hypothetical protein
MAEIIKNLDNYSPEEQSLRTELFKSWVVDLQHANPELHEKVIVLVTTNCSADHLLKDFNLKYKASVIV